METMLRICEQYAAENNLEFSTDPNPDKSKSKCIFMCGHLKKAQPANLQLYGVDLPWVKTATHLGHELSWECNMEEDMRTFLLKSGSPLTLLNQTKFSRLSGHTALICMGP